MGRAALTLVLVVIIAWSGTNYLDGKRDNPLKSSSAMEGAVAVAYKDISPAELNQWLQSDKAPVVVDVREPAETATGHIRGAKLIPLGDLGSRWQELDPDQEVVMVCQSGRRSSLAAKALVSQGFTKVYNMTGGMTNWTYDTTK